VELDSDVDAELRVFWEEGTFIVLLVVISWKGRVRGLGESERERERET
jgi:hypothetical protein